MTFVLLFDVGWTETLPNTPVDETPPGPEVPEKIKKRYRKKKTKLEEAFPTYLQVRHLYSTLFLFECKLRLWRKIKYFLYLYKPLNIHSACV